MTDDSFPPLIWKWVPGEDNNGVMEPVKAHRARAESYFVYGELYRLEPRLERSGKSHRHYFASINDAWKNLPEDIAHRFPTPEHLRKWALVQEGFADERVYTFDTQKDAQQFITVLRSYDPFCIIKPAGNVVQVWVAKSQALRAMNAKQFQESKQKVLDRLESMIGVPHGVLQKNAGRDEA